MSHSEFLQSRVSAHGPWIQDRTSDFNPKLKPVMHFEAASQPAELPPLTRRACASPGAGLCRGFFRGCVFLCALSCRLLVVLGRLQVFWLFVLCIGDIYCFAGVVLFS